MVPKDYEEVEEGVYQSDSFDISRPPIDSTRVRQILNEQRPSPADTDCSNTDTSRWESEHTAQDSNQHSGA